MKKCVIIPDSFKGTLRAIEFCEIAAERVRTYYPDCEIVAIPVADGGEGTVDCFLHAMAGERVTIRVNGPYSDTVEACYARFGSTAVIEMAQAAGLPLIDGTCDPSSTTTYGVGQLMEHAVRSGCTDLVIGLGGSCTNDAGCGMAAALGVRFTDDAGRKFVPTGGTLHQIHGIDRSAAQALLKNCTLTAMCDIDNPMYGKNGAAFVFGPQKGADPAMVKLLDLNLHALSAAIEQTLDLSVAQLPGAGAAGAMGAGVVAFLGGTLKPGIQTVLDLIGFERLMENTDLVLTGEGRIDDQSLRGKVVIGVSERAKRCGVPVVAVVGDVGEQIEGVYDRGVSAVFSINRVALPFEQARRRTKQDLRDTLDAILRFSVAIAGR